jgi:hypothetical protein
MTGDATINSAGVLTVANNAITAAKINALAVEAAKIAENAVTTAKIAGLAITTAKLAELGVTATKIAAEAIETGKIKALAVTTAKIALLAITEALLADGAVTSRKFRPTSGESLYGGGEFWLPFGGGGATIAIRSISVSVASFIDVTAVLHAGQRSGNQSADQIVYDLWLNGGAQGRGGIFGMEQTPAIPGVARSALPAIGHFAVGAGTHTVELRASCTNNNGAAFTPSGFRYLVYSQ